MSVENKSNGGKNIIDYLLDWFEQFMLADYVNNVLHQQIIYIYHKKLHTLNGLPNHFFDKIIEILESYNEEEEYDFIDAYMEFKRIFGKNILNGKFDARYNGLAKKLGLE